jgi:ankyrin repeat protein
MGSYFGRDPYSSYGFTLLHFAAKDGCDKVINALLSSPNIDVNIKSKRARTALSYAAEYGHLNIVNLLLQHSADAMLSLRMRDLPICLAAYYGHAEVVAALLPYTSLETVIGYCESSRGAYHDEDCPFYIAVSRGHANVLQLLLLSCPGININQHYSNDATVLHEAVRHQYIDVISLLLSQPAINPNEQDKKGNVPLINAIYYENYRAIEALLKHQNIDLTIKNQKGRTVFDIAKDRADAEIINLLSSRKAPSSIENMSISTTLATFFQPQDMLIESVSIQPPSSKGALLNKSN